MFQAKKQRFVLFSLIQIFSATTGCIGCAGTCSPEYRHGGTSRPATCTVLLKSADQDSSHSGRLVRELACKHDVALLERIFRLLDEPTGGVVLRTAIGIQ